MTLNEYQEFAAQGILSATAEHPTPVVGFALGLVGETGEVVDDIKKESVSRSQHSHGTYSRRAGRCTLVHIQYMYTVRTEARRCCAR